VASQSARFQLPRAVPAALIASLLLAAGCADAIALDADLVRVERRLEQALADGAYYCAPRELAQARAQLDFARVDHEQGEPTQAREHLNSAELNVRAAERLSPADRCASSATSEQAPHAVFNRSDEPDADKDGVPDAADSCPNVAEDVDGALDADGCPDPDNDLDGIPDTIDQCPFQAEDVDGDKDTDGCPDVTADSDGDGVDDNADRCPNEFGVASNQGCERSHYPGAELTASELRLTAPILFEDTTATIRSVSFPALDVIVEVLKEHPKVTFEVQGHTDSQGDDAENMTLTQQRAEAVVRYLVQRGVEPSRLTAKGYGETRPIESNRTSQGREVNRRVELIRTDGSR
jgi:outer membrane protein OmpA-like peptidoglycan-associated protein